MSWYNEKDRVIGKIIIRAQIKNVSSLILGSGEDAMSDVDCVKLANNQAYIPGSVLTGCIWRKFEEINEFKEIIGNLWGTKNAKENDPISSQSHIMIEDSISNGNGNDTAHFTVKDAVKILHDTNQAKEGGKFDYEILEPEVTFDIKAEITLRKGFDKDKYLKAAFYILSILENDFHIGAKTNSGFGKMEVKDDSGKVFFFDFEEKLAGNKVDSWFEYLEADGDVSKLISEPSPTDKIHFKGKADFSVDAKFKIKSSLLSRSYLVDADAPDHVHTHRNEKPDQPILYGSSIKGAIRHRAYKILNTLKGEDYANCVIDELFGYVRENKNGINGDSKAKKGKIRIEESTINDVVHTEQTRIKIDRFTGGTIDGALIQSRPVWSKGDEPNLTIKWSINNPSHDEITLILMVLKDLWTADLAIGGDKAIGRGVLEGREATIIIDGESATLTDGENGFAIDGWEVLKLYNEWSKENKKDDMTKDQKDAA
ncbi:MAG: RAMP superfamily CRISPR-associated protein [Saprospiraceae bacterium]